MPFKLNGYLKLYLSSSEIRDKTARDPASYFSIYFIYFYITSRLQCCQWASFHKTKKGVLRGFILVWQGDLIIRRAYVYIWPLRKV